MVGDRDSLSTSPTHSKTPEGVREGSVKTCTKDSKCKGPEAGVCRVKETISGQEQRDEGDDASRKPVLPGKGFGSG